MEPMWPVRLLQIRKRIGLMSALRLIGALAHMDHVHFESKMTCEMPRLHYEAWNPAFWMSKMCIINYSGNPTWQHLYYHSRYQCIVGHSVWNGAEYGWEAFNKHLVSRVITGMNYKANPASQNFQVWRGGILLRWKTTCFHHFLMKGLKSYQFILAG